MSDHQEDDLSAIDDTGSALPDSWFRASDAHDLEEGMKILQAAQKGEHGASDEASANGEESGQETDDEGYGGEAAEPSFYSGRKRKHERLGAGWDDVPVPGAGAQLMPKKLTEEETAKARKPVHSILDNVALVHSIFDTGLLDTGFDVDWNNPPQEYITHTADYESFCFAKFDAAGESRVQAFYELPRDFRSGDAACWPPFLAAQISAASWLRQQEEFASAKAAQDAAAAAAAAAAPRAIRHRASTMGIKESVRTNTRQPHGT